MNHDRSRADQASTRRVTRDEALTCCLNGQLVATTVPQGGPAHEADVDIPWASDLDQLSATMEFRLLEPEARPPDVRVLDSVERELPLEVQDAATAQPEPAKKVNAMGLRLLDQATGIPLAQVDLFLRGTRGGASLRARTDARGRATFQNVGRGPLQLLLNDSIFRSAVKNTTPRIAPEKFNKVEDATPAQIELIKEAHVKAETMMASAIERLKAAKSKPDSLVKEYFGIAGTGKEDQRRLDRLTAGVSKMLKGMKSVGYEVENEAITPGEPYTVAYVYTLPLLGGVGDVHICFPPFGRGTVDSRAATIVHEVSHSRAGTKDHAYDWQKKKWAAMTQDQRLNNADSLAEFAREAGG